MRALWEWLDNSGHGEYTDWQLQPPQRAKLDQKLEMLRTAEVDSAGRVSLPTNLLAGPGYKKQKGIYKLKVHGNVQLRPMVTLGQIGDGEGWAILVRAVEKDGKLIPADAPQKATKRRAMLANPTRRRRILDDDQ